MDTDQMQKFFKKVENIKLVENFKMTESENTYQFEYKSALMTASQTTKEKLTVSKINYGLQYEDLLKDITLNQIYETMNKYNKKFNIIKIILHKVDGLNVYMRFSVEYSIPDNLFESLKIEDMEDNLKLIIGASEIFIKSLAEDY